MAGQSEWKRGLAVQRIGHAIFETPDLERLIEYYVHVIGLSLAARENGRAHLATSTGLLALTLVQGEAARCTGVAFQIDPARTLSDAAAALRDKHEIASERRSDGAPGIADALRFTDSNGTAIEVFTTCDRLAADDTPKRIVPLKLGHLAFKTNALEPAVRFYEEVLGFRVSDWREDFFVWMRCGPEHHTANFVRGDTIKMHHFAFELKDASEILRACDALGQAQYKIVYGPGRHVIGDNIFVYHRNPDGQIVEFYTELARIESEPLGEFSPRPWHRVTPYQPRIWGPGTPGNLWGPGAPPGFADG